MKAASAFLFLVLLASDVSGESSGAPARSECGLLSFSLTASIATSTGPNDRSLGNVSRENPMSGATVSCQYLLPFVPLFIGTDLGCSLAIEPHTWALSILHAGFSVGFRSDPRRALGLRLFGSAGYSCSSIQRSDSDFLSIALQSGNGVAKRGSPYVGAGAELLWSFVPCLNVAAGVRYRYLPGLADVGATLGISLDLPP